MPRNPGHRDDDPELRFEAMFRQHYPQVDAYVRRRTTGDAGDVVGEVFLTAWRRLDRVPADSLPWLLGVARKALANARRSEHRRPAVAIADAGGVPGPESNPAERLEVAEAFARLSDRDREVLMLVAWDGLTPARAARVLGCSVPAFHVRLHRARARLARALEARDGADLLTREEAE